MDATSSSKQSWRMLTTIALCTLSVLAVHASRLSAEESNTTSMIVVTSSSNSKPEPASSSPTSAHGTLSFVRPSEAETKPAHLSRQAQANRFSQSLNAFRGSPAEESQAHSQSISRPISQRPADSTVQSGPIRQRSKSTPSKVSQITAGIRAASKEARLSGRDTKPQPEANPAHNVQVARYQEDVTQPRAVDPATKLLIRAHALSERATTEAEYTEIVGQCAQAVRSRTDKEKSRFAYQLSSWALNRRGQLHADQGRQDRADADFAAALNFNPKNWRALHNRGVSHAQTGSFADAFDDFNLVIQLNPRFAQAYVNRATLYVQANDLRKALKDYQQAARLNPDSVKAQVGIGRVSHMLGLWDQALTHFGAAVRLKPDNAEVLCSRADLLADMGRYQEALADYAQTLEVDPEFGHAYRNGAWLLATCPDEQFRDAENALRGARQVLELGYGQRHVALDTLAAALANAGQFGEAKDTLQNALNIAPAEAKTVYASRLQLYEQRQPFRTHPVDNVSQAVYEATDR